MIRFLTGLTASLARNRLSRNVAITAAIVVLVWVTGLWGYLNDGLLRESPPPSYKAVVTCPNCGKAGKVDVPLGETWIESPKFSGGFAKCWNCEVRMPLSEFAEYKNALRVIELRDERMVMD